MSIMPEYNPDSAPIYRLTDHAASVIPRFMTAAIMYWERTLELLDDLREKEMRSIEEASEICASSISEGGLVFLFGSGHSRMMCEEMTPRQGCFPGFVSMVELSLSNHAAIIGSNGLRAPLYLERYEGYAEEILKSFHFGPHDAFIAVSTSGVRPVIVEMAAGAQRRGLPVIAILSRAHAEACQPGHSSGKNLLDFANVIIDNHCPPGDCILELEGLDWRTGPASTVTGAVIINMLRCETAERLLARGIKPELLPSHQIIGDPSIGRQLDRFYEAYRVSLRHLYD